MPADQELVARVRIAITEQSVRLQLTVREKHRFAGRAFMLNDKVACGELSTTH